MRHLTIALMLPSAIHRAGISNIVRKLPDMACAFVELSPINYLDEIARHRPSILIADPAWAEAEWDALKSPSAPPIKLIALLSGQAPREGMRWFDDTIGLYDQPDTIIATIKRNIAPEKEADRTRELSPREKEVVIGIVKGLSNKEIAAGMNVSVNTVMTHRRNIAAKLHIHSAAGLTVYAIVSDLVSLDDIKDQ